MAPTFTGSSARRAAYTASSISGTAAAASTPMIAAVIINSMRVKPLFMGPRGLGCAWIVPCGHEY